MFRRSLPLAFLLAMTALAPATSAQAADVTTVTLDVTIADSSFDPDEITVEFRVTGTDLDNGTLTQPITNATPIALEKDGDDLVITDEFANEAELATFLPSGNYALRINDGTVLATLVYARPAVPSPDITSPTAHDTVPPGPIELTFHACPVCNLSGDSVTAVLEDDNDAVLAEETLTAASTSWIPQGVGGALALAEDSAFVARVTHDALREATTPVTDDDDTLVFSHHFVQSDEIDFDTGFRRPEGHVCLAANYEAAPEGCTVITDPALLVVDTSGVFSTVAAGHDVELTVTLAANGALSGSATADLDDDGTPETDSTPIRGKLSGKGGEARSHLSLGLSNSALSAKLKLLLSEMLSIPGNTRSSTQRTSGKIGTTKIKETTPSSGALPFAPLGWLLEFDIDELPAVQNALLTLEGGRTFALTGKHKFKLGSGRSSVKLRSTAKGIRIELGKVTFDDSTSPVGTSGGSVSPRILGQSGKTTLESD